MNTRNTTTVYTPKENLNKKENQDVSCTKCCTCTQYKEKMKDRGRENEKYENQQKSMCAPFFFY